MRHTPAATAPPREFVAAVPFVVAAPFAPFAVCACYRERGIEHREERSLDRERPPPADFIN
jgi:hypothetical protein